MNHSKNYKKIIHIEECKKNLKNEKRRVFSKQNNLKIFIVSNKQWIVQEWKKKSKTWQKNFLMTKQLGKIKCNFQKVMGSSKSTPMSSFYLQ